MDTQPVERRWWDLLALSGPMLMYCPAAIEMVVRAWEAEAGVEHHREAPASPPPTGRPIPGWRKRCRDRRSAPLAPRVIS
jgi:hypothetical protein